MNTESVGKTIYEHRKLKGLTQKDLAEALHVSNQAVSKWERGLNFPDLALMDDLAKVLGISVIELMGLQDESNENVINQVIEISKEDRLLAHKKRQKLLMIAVGAVFLIAVILAFYFRSIYLFKDGGVKDVTGYYRSGQELTEAESGELSEIISDMKFRRHPFRSLDYEAKAGTLELTVLCAGDGDDAEAGTKYHLTLQPDGKSWIYVVSDEERVAVYDALNTEALVEWSGNNYIDKNYEEILIDDWNDFDDHKYLLDEHPGGVLLHNNGKVIGNCVVETGDYTYYLVGVVINYDYSGKYSESKIYADGAEISMDELRSSAEDMTADFIGGRFRN